MVGVRKNINKKKEKDQYLTITLSVQSYVSRRDTGNSQIIISYSNTKFTQFLQALPHVDHWNNLFRQVFFFKVLLIVHHKSVYFNAGTGGRRGATSRCARPESHLQTTGIRRNRRRRKSRGESERSIHISSA